MNVVEQGILPLARKPAEVDVPLDIIVRKKDQLAAINLCIDVSGLEDKEIYMALAIDPGHFSNIRKGKSGCHFPTNKLNELCDLCGNEIPLIWWAHSRGKGLHMLETESERQLKIEREAREKAEAENALLRNLIQGRAK